MIEDLLSPKKLGIKRMIGDYISKITDEYEPTLINDVLGLKPTTLKKIKRGETDTIELKMMRERFAKGLLRDRFRSIIKKEDRATLRAFVDSEYMDLIRLKNLSDEENQATFKKLAEKKLYEFLSENRYDFIIRLCCILSKKGAATTSYINEHFPALKAQRFIEDLEERGIVDYCSETDSYHLLCDFNFTHIPSLESKFLRDITENCLDSSETDANDLIIEYYLGFVTTEDYRTISRDHKLSFNEKAELAERSASKRNADIPVLLFQACVSLGKKIPKETNIFDDEAGRRSNGPLH